MMASTYGNPTCTLIGEIFLTTGRGNERNALESERPPPGQLAVIPGNRVLSAIGECGLAQFELSIRKSFALSTAISFASLLSPSPPLSSHSSHLVNQRILRALSSSASSLLRSIEVTLLSSFRSASISSSTTVKMADVPQERKSIMGMPPFIIDFLVCLIRLAWFLC